MTPYYDDGQITIYCGDCRDVLPSLPSVDLVLTDPPYNAGKDYEIASDALAADEYAALMTEVTTHALRLAPHQAWVSPRYQMALFLGLLPGAHLVVVQRGAAGKFCGGWRDQFETVLTIGKPSRSTPDLWSDVRLKGEGYFFREDTFGHPGYTPSLIFKRCAALLCPTDGSLIDPFMGTGTALVVAKELGLRATGIEINERYCEIAARRLAQQVLPLEVLA